MKLVGKKTAGWVGVAGAICCGLVSQAVASEPARERPFTIVCLGDSITKAGYPAELEKNIAAKVINAGVNGNTSRQGLARLERDVLAHKPDLVLVLFGANDSRQDAPKTHVPLEEYSKNLNEIIVRSQRAGSKVILGTLPPIEAEAYYTRHPREFYEPVGGLEPWLLRYRATALSVGKSNNVPVVDLYRLLEREPGWRKADGVHPTEEGNRAIARLFAERIKTEIGEIAGAAASPGNTDPETKPAPQQSLKTKPCAGAATACPPGRGPTERLWPAREPG
jgi:lysophospholipase L1-like esterase